MDKQPNTFIIKMWCTNGGSNRIIEHRAVSLGTSTCISCKIKRKIGINVCFLMVFPYLVATMSMSAITLGPSIKLTSRLLLFREALERR